MIRVVFDVAELAPGMGKSVGIYNYAVNLFRHMQTLLGDELHLHVACNLGCAPDFKPLAGAPVTQHVVLPQVMPGAVARQRWIRWGAQRFARQLGADIYFSPKGFLPGAWGSSAGVRTVVVLHDLIPLWYRENRPGYFGRLEEAVVNQGLLRAARYASELIVISQSTAEDVKRRVDRNAAHLHVIYNGVPHVPAGRDRPVGNPYMFAVTSALPHKNAEGLLAAYRCYREMVSDPLPLVVCGIEDPGQAGVSAIRGVDAQTLHNHYAHAELFLFLSLVEGFGFPPLEAMWHGTPVLCSDIPVLREVTQGGAMFVDPLQPKLVAGEMVHLLRDRATLCALRDASKEVAQGYDWTSCAQGVLNVLRDLGRSAA